MEPSPTTPELLADGLAPPPSRGVSKPWRPQSSSLRWLMLGPGLLVILATVIYPLIASLITSFRDWRLINSPTPGPFVGLSNYARAFTDAGFLNSLGVSALYTLISVTLTLLTGLAIALILAKPTRLNVFARTLLIFPFAVAPVLKGYSWRFMLNPEYGVYSKMLGEVFAPLKGYVWLGHDFSALVAIAMSEIWGWAPLFALMFIGALGSIPTEATEAARVDGATSFQIFRRITLPLLAPVIYIVALLKIISAVKMFDQVAIMTGGGPGDSTQTLYFFVYQVAFRNLDLGYASAVSYIIVAVMALLATLYVRTLMRGD
ncbi:carbohydrate ABC transporter permease [Deinococcus hopiensis]|uniref:Multiple sugar transport system permease protein n=1 Tax=Deinococcus hopiensis KR-140 TaxID=695939 RepID=A0A1W1ULE8_9DEIO|nr:sugar ABC transporter permease [Deinococcus hopiensis]SMB81907.1 multiple sugar transport system permease protein [Deinococcus hopiensis KR-140]